ncbi:MAG: DNA polymerase A family protein, partial [Anaerovoracaceae bacterium]
FLNRWGDDAAFDGRIHPSFGLTNVVTGRTSCSEPNLQQVPRTQDIRGLFTGAPGMILFEADYSQLELRIAAHYANERTMLEIYRKSGDIHTETARIFTGGNDPTKEERGKAKAVNFGFLYGMQYPKFVKYAFDSYGVVFTMQEAKNYRDLFFAKYSRLLPWHKEMEELCELQGGVANLFGRFRRLPDIYSSNKWERASAARKAINTPVQGTGSDLLISAATQINKELKGIAIIGATVHDSIVGECRVEDKDEVDEAIRKIMRHPKVLDDFGVTLNVPIDVDIGWGPWGTH